MLRASLTAVLSVVLGQAIAFAALASDFDDGAANVLVSSELSEVLAAEGILLPTLAEWSGAVGKLKGETVYIGRGFAAGLVFPGPDNAYLANPSGRSRPSTDSHRPCLT